jgi:cytochrome c-type biogenesis protein CcmI
MTAMLGAALPLILGALLAVAALGFVLWPLWAQATARPVARPRAAAPTGDAENPIDALREIEFDRATGKLSDDDYVALKTRYTQRALVAMRSAEPSEPVVVVPASEVALDPAEAEVLRYRARQQSCPTCGPRPEPDAVFCSECGRFLRDRCAACGTPVDNVAARFCTSCGTSFASVA